MLSFLDARLFGGVLFNAQLQRDGETFPMRRSIFACQMVLMIEFIVACQLVDATHGSLFFGGVRIAAVAGVAVAQRHQG